MSFEILAWRAWSANATREEVAEKLALQKAEILRLRAVATAARTVTDLHPQATQTHDVHLSEAIIKLRQALAVMESR